MASESKRMQDATIADATVFLVRPGRTELNVSGALGGHLDVPLDAVGVAQASALGAVLARMDVAAVVSSPLARARSTAEAIGVAVGTDVTVEAGLIDRDYGSWAGTPHDEVVRRFGSLDAAPGVEPGAALAARVATTITVVVNRWAPGAVVVVGHDAVNRHVLARLVPSVGDADHLPQRTGCWSRLQRGIWWAPVVDAVPEEGRLP